MVIQNDGAGKHDAEIAEMKAQLRAWSAQLDDLVASAISAGGKSRDAYRVRIEALRSRHTAVQTKLDAFDEDSHTRAEWRAMRTAIKDDWAAIEDNLKDLSR